jgi:molybdopterin-guanine dinucleotide biosynthesis protein A
MDAGAIILAGGKSSRMGTNKALLKINETPNIERILMSLQAVFPQPILVCNDPEPYQYLGIKIVNDHFPGKGPLAGIHAGLKASSHEINLVVACDMPFVSVVLAEDLLNKSGDWDAVVPVIEGRQHPLFAVYKKKLVVVIEKMINEERLRMKDLLDQVRVRYLTEQELKLADSPEQIFFNMNHPQEYEEALQLAVRNIRKRGNQTPCNFSK